MFFLKRTADDTTAVYMIHDHQAKVWRPWPGRWVLTADNEWTGIGGSTDFDEATDDEVRDALIAAGVDPLDVDHVMCGGSTDPRRNPRFAHINRSSRPAVPWIRTRDRS